MAADAPAVFKVDRHLIGGSDATLAQCYDVARYQDRYPKALVSILEGGRRPGRGQVPTEPAFLERRPSFPSVLRSACANWRVGRS
jgi:hypothetical protein